MAITRLQQARQMRKGGGIMGSNAGSMLVAPTRDGSRPGYYGPDAGFGDDDYKDAAADFARDDNPRGAGVGITDRDARRVLDARPDLQQGIDNAAIAKAKQQKEAKKEKERIDKILEIHRGKTPAAYAYGPPIKNYKKEYFTGPNKFSTATKMRQLALKNLIDKKMGLKSTMPSIFEMNNLFNPKLDYEDKLGNYLGTDYTYNSGITTDMMGANLQDYSDMSKYGLTGKNMTDIDRMNKALDMGRETGEITQQQFEDAFNSQIIPGDGGGGQTILPYPYNVQQPDEEVPEDTGPEYRFGTGQNIGADVTRGSYIFNQGGRVPRNMGGIMNVVPRQGYFLGGIGKSIGKAFKGVAKAAGKVLKSDVGKMALLAAGAYYTGGALGGTGGFNNFATLGSKAMQGAKFLGKKALFTNGALDFGKAAVFGTSVLPFFMKQPENPDIGMAKRGGRLIDPLTGEEGTPQSMRENIELAKLEADGDPVKLDALNQKYNNMLFTNKPYENYGTYANGGRISRAEGGLMNLGGMEKDYRAEGGFVPIGREEKADDVPARLSVNEFVFTADAVRNAGGGDIDRGAEVMENMMKNLENGGRVSEESQGNTGAQNMFSVSERIGEVI